MSREQCNVNKLRKNEEDHSPAPRRTLLAIHHAEDAEAQRTQREEKREEGKVFFK